LIGESAGAMLAMHDRRGIDMRLRKLGAALVVIAALGIVLASSSFAAATTTDVKWYTGSPGTELSASETVSAKQAGTGTLTTTIAGTAVKLSATGTECVECKIENSGGTAVGSGKLTFTGVTVVEPAKCTTSASITTKALTIQSDWMIGTTNYIKFFPSAGEATALTTVELAGSGCALAGLYKVTGTVFAQSVNSTGTSAATQAFKTSGTINSTAGGSLKMGENAATLTTEAAFKLSGTKAGAVFGTACPCTQALPGETTVTGFKTITEEGQEVPVINWEQATPIDTSGCKGGKVAVIIEAENTETHKIETRESSLKEGEGAKFSGTTPIMKPLHGHATVKISVTGCEKAGEESHVEFKCWIDPSGKVVDGNHENAPLWEATVTLLSSPTESGTYTAVENGSEVMSPANRVNPDKSRENGAFGWDVIEGYYKVEATKAGCGTSTTSAFHVPPPQENLKIVLHCEGEQWKLGEEPGEIAQLAVTAPAKKCEGKVRVENVSFGAASIKVLKETGIECTLKKVCEGKSLGKGEKCETELEKPGTKPEYELEVEWKGKKFTKKFPV
jgi:hypothetical protein